VFAIPICPPLLGRALLANPTILLLDEPTEGVWIGVIEEIAERLRDLAHEICIVLVEQHLDLALSVAEYAYPRACAPKATLFRSSSRQESTA
jgi:ABC-type Mn2+/Zn2+ transport system ATPase subunit